MYKLTYNTEAKEFDNLQEVHDYLIELLKGGSELQTEEEEYVLTPSGFIEEYLNWAGYFNYPPHLIQEGEESFYLELEQTE